MSEQIETAARAEAERIAQEEWPERDSDLDVSESGAFVAGFERGAAWQAAQPRTVSRTWLHDTWRDSQKDNTPHPGLSWEDARAARFLAALGITVDAEEPSEDAMSTPPTAAEVLTAHRATSIKRVLGGPDGDNPWQVTCNCGSEFRRVWQRHAWDAHAAHRDEEVHRADERGGRMSGKSEAGEVR